MKFLGTTCGALLAFALVMTPVATQAQNPQTIDNGTITTAVYGGGQIGGDCSGAHPGFIFNGVGGGGTVLCGAGFLASTSSTVVIGDTYFAVDGSADWTQGTWSNTSSPYADLEVAHTTSFTDIEGQGLSVDFTVYYSNDDDAFEQFFVAQYDVTNNSGGTLDIARGLFMDWDIDPFATNNAKHDGTTAQWVLGDGTSITEIFGTAVLDPGNGDVLSGTDCFHPYTTTDGAVYTAMTNLGAADCGGGLDIRGPVGAGEHSVGNGETTTALFCIIAANDETDFVAQVANCQSAVAVAIEPGPDGVPGTHNLSTVYPNPFNPQARFTLEVAEQQDVRIAVYDVLGREVATLYSGTLTAGPAHEFTIDGAGLPSGSYVIRAFGEHFSDTRSVTLMK
ncbi:MAG: T9SS type A sorting domain-containing protein [Saprospiraceae bacterium]|nr:T9SS type A sorting domain-containing protein [Saprospiraceae bacterium]